MPPLTTPTIAAGSLAASAQPDLVAGELLLRPWRPSDVPELVAAYADPGIQQWHGRSLTAQEAAAWIIECGEQWRLERGAHWAVCAAERLLGRLGLGRIDRTDGLGVVVYWVAPAARGRRIAPRALERLATWAFDEAGFHRLELEHSTRNLASCRVAERAGFAAEGVRRSAARHADGWHDMHLHARIAPGAGASPGSGTHAGG